MLSRTVNDKNTLIEDDFDTEMVVIEISDTMSKSWCYYLLFFIERNF